MSIATAAPRPTPLVDRLIAVAPWLFLAVCFAFSVHYTKIGWRAPLLGNWSFRQTQTAISAQYLLKDGFRLDYETPVLGAPWSLPFEFPTYQLCVAATVKLTHQPLDRAGRLVSLLFAYGAFTLLGVLVTRTSGSLAAGVYATSLALVSPLYLFVSRLFMIESTALFFTLALLVAVHAFLRRPRPLPLLWIFLAGSLAGPTKATTYAVGLVAVVGLILLELRATWAILRPQPQRWRLLVGFFFALALPFFLTVAWTRYTDVVKLRNELADFTTSDALKDWNFGTFAQKCDLFVWDKMLGYVSDFVLGTPIAWLVLLILFAVGRAANAVTAVFVAALFTGFAVFTNLYAVHDYYLYAAGVYLLAIAAQSLGTLAARGRAGSLCAAFLAAPALAACMLWGFHVRLLPAQTNTTYKLLALAQKVGELTPPDSVIIVEGNDWNSALPYYAGRRALMNRAMLDMDDPRMQRALARLNRPLGAIVFVAPFKDETPNVLRRLRSLPGISLERVFTSDEGDIYLPAQPDGRWRREFEWTKAGFTGHPYFAWSPYQVGEVGYEGRTAMLVHAPGEIWLTRTAAQHRLSASFAMLDASYKGTDGVTFVIDFESPAGDRTRLMERRLRPVDTPADRQPQTVEFELPPGQAGYVILRTETGPDRSFDYSLWRDVKLD